MYMYVQTQWKSLRASTHQSIKRSFFQWEDQWLLFSSLFWGEEGLISKSLKLINYFNFFLHHTGNLWMHFHCKIPNSTFINRKKINIIRGKKHHKTLFLPVCKPIWCNLTIKPSYAFSLIKVCRHLYLRGAPTGRQTVFLL